MTIRELAKALNLSAATVSAALSRHPERYHLSAKTVQRVRAFANQAGYVPNQLAIKLFNKESQNAVGLLFLQGSADDRTLPVLNAAMRFLTEHHREHQVFSCLDIHTDRTSFPEAIRHIRGMKLQHLVVIGGVMRLYPLTPQLYQGLQLYFPDYDDYLNPIPDFPRFVGISDRRQFHHHLMERIARQGLGPVATHEAVADLCDEWQGEWARVLGDNSAEVNCFKVGRDYAEELLPLIRQGKCRTIVVHHDRIAVGIMRRLLEAGIRIPGQVQIFGYNDSEFAPYAPIPLTSVRTPLGTLAQKVLEHLVLDTPLPQTQCQPLELIQRESSLPLPEI
ncbi:MAG: substrate-binding domain-containing protein [Oligosphaeraceae bacterium]